ncbi:MAG: DUF2341 domain-containing protein, partial [Elusimicrobiota bacterium]|nr:DUF2341 domain-containing protein [Endomicrobiia bacterium]MDW8166179.1 DUF2341 domain-containing protein [Elusimicrobiota bacterium]
GCNSPTSFIRVVVPSIPANSIKTIYMYYGNPSATYNNQLSNIFSDTIGVMSATLPSGRETFSCVPYGDSIYCFGGWTGSSYLNQIVRYNVTSNTVTVMSATLPSGRSLLSCAPYGDSIYCFGGYDGNQLNQIVRYNVASNTVTVMSATLPSGRPALSCAPYGDSIYCFGGWTGSDQIVRYGLRFVSPEPNISISSREEASNIDITITSPADNTVFYTLDYIDVLITFSATSRNHTNFALLSFLNGNIIYNNTNYVNGTVITLTRNLIHGRYNLTVVASALIGNNTTITTESTHFFSIVSPALNISFFEERTRANLIEDLEIIFFNYNESRRIIKGNFTNLSLVITTSTSLFVDGSLTIYGYRNATTYSLTANCIISSATWCAYNISRLRFDGTWTNVFFFNSSVSSSTTWRFNISFVNSTELTNIIRLIISAGSGISSSSASLFLDPVFSPGIGGGGNYLFINWTFINLTNPRPLFLNVRSINHNIYSDSQSVFLNPTFAAPEVRTNVYLLRTVFSSTVTFRIVEERECGRKYFAKFERLYENPTFVKDALFDFNCIAAVNLEPYQFYRLKIFDYNAKTIYETDLFKIAQSEYLIYLPTTGFKHSVTYLNNYGYSLLYYCSILDNNTVICTVTDSNNKVFDSYFSVRYPLFLSRNITLCEQSSRGSSATYFCNVPNNTKEVFVSLSFKPLGEDKVITLFGSIMRFITTELKASSALTIVLFLIIAIATITNPALFLISTTLSLIVMQWIGLIDFAAGAINLLIALTFFIFIILIRRNEA